MYNDTQVVEFVRKSEDFVVAIAHGAELHIEPAVLIIPPFLQQKIKSSPKYRADTMTRGIEQRKAEYESARRKYQQTTKDSNDSTNLKN